MITTVPLTNFTLIFIPITKSVSEYTFSDLPNLKFEKYLFKPKNAKYGEKH